MSTNIAEKMSITLTLPNGDQLNFDHQPTGLEVAQTIGTGLAKAAIAVELDGTQQDLSEPILADHNIKILTAKDADGMDILRHTITAQCLAKAIKELYPDAKLAIGPTIEHGFYYDIDFPQPPSANELPEIEDKMREIMATGAPIQREMWPSDKAISYFEGKGESYKAEIIRDANATEVSVYRQGDSYEAFVDLCFGPHLPHLGLIPTDGFKLTNLAGAYWRGDSNNKQLTRIYGVAFANKKELNAHLTMLEEAAKRDHRKLGKQMDLFHFQDEAPGMVFWHSNGWTMFLELMNYMREKVRKHGYVEVNTPQLLDVNFWKASGHWDKYRENMFVVGEEEETPFALKPMNCPGNVQVFKQKINSYRELPVRMAEFGKVFRQEAHGARHGLMRVQSFTQDDAHIFCTPEQLEEEVIKMCDLIAEVYKDFGFSDITVMFSTRPEEYIGTLEDWERAESALQKVCDRLDMKWELNPGDGAFYAPKLDFVLHDAIGRSWQCGTIQVDMNLPTRLDITYMGEDGQKHRPHMVHRAIVGSLERFLGVVVEHFGGNFPLWIAPTQVAITGVSEKQHDGVNALVQELQESGIRAIADNRDDKINYKIRDLSVQKVPIIAVIGDKELENSTITVRRLGSQAQETVPLEAFKAAIRQEIDSRALPPNFTDSQ